MPISRNSIQGRICRYLRERGARTAREIAHDLGEDTRAVARHCMMLDCIEAVDVREVCTAYNQAKPVKLWAYDERE